MTVGVWRMKDGKLYRVPESSVDFEKQLEEWIENEPTLIGSGLQIVGRQLAVASGRLDLLAIDLQGQWVVIEIKRGQVSRDTMSQALDYASYLAVMPQETLAEQVDAYLKQRGPPGASTLAGVLEQRQRTLADCLQDRQVQIILVGTGRDPNLGRIVDFLNERGDSLVSVVSFEVFSLPSGEEVLIRELTELDETVELAPRRAYIQPKSLDELFARANKEGAGAPFRRLVEGAVAAGLYPRLWPRSVMLTPPQHKGRCLLTVWTSPSKDGGLVLYVAGDAFCQFFGLSREGVVAALGDGWRTLLGGDVDTFIAKLSGLISLRPGPQLALGGEPEAGNP